MGDLRDPTGRDGSSFPPPALLTLVLIALGTLCVVAGVAVRETAGLRWGSFLEAGPVRGLGALLALCGATMLAFHHRGETRAARAAGHRPRPHTGSAVRIAALCMVGLAWFAFLSSTRPLPGPEEAGGAARVAVSEDADPSDLTPPPDTPPGRDLDLSQEQEGPSPAGPGSLPPLDPAQEEVTVQPAVEPEPPLEPAVPGAPLLPWIAGLLALMAALILLRARRPAGAVAPDMSEVVPEPPAPDPAEALRASLLRLRDPKGDPRSQVTAAYRGLLAALGQAGAARGPHEGPQEHLARILTPVLAPRGVDPGPLRALASLYVRAEFSDHLLTARHRDRAVAALEHSLEALEPSALGAA